MYCKECVKILNLKAYAIQGLFAKSKFRFMFCTWKRTFGIAFSLEWMYEIRLAFKLLWMNQNRKKNIMAPKILWFEYLIKLYCLNTYKRVVTFFPDDFLFFFFGAAFPRDFHNPLKSLPSKCVSRLHPYLQPKIASFLGSRNLLNNNTEQ